MPKKPDDLDLIALHGKRDCHPFFIAYHNAAEEFPDPLGGLIERTAEAIAERRWCAKCKALSSRLIARTSGGLPFPTQATPFSLFPM
jgi:hypothetical protein